MGCRVHSFRPGHRKPLVLLAMFNDNQDSMKLRHRQFGFSVVEPLLYVVILVIIGSTSYFVYHAQQSTDKVLNESDKTASSIVAKTTTTNKAATTSSPSSLSTSTTSSTASNQDYLVVKEWGVEFPLSSAINSAVYSSGQYSTGSASATGGSAKLGLLSLGSDCGDSSSAPLGQYVEFRQQDVSGEDVSLTTTTPTLHDLAKTAVEVPGSDGGYGGYYIAYVPPASACSDDSATLKAATAAFQQALQGMKPADS